MKFISSHVNNDISKGLQREYYVYFVPRRAVACEKVLSYLSYQSYAMSLSFLFCGLHTCIYFINALKYLFHHADSWGGKCSPLVDHRGVSIVYSSTRRGCFIFWTWSCLQSMSVIYTLCIANLLGLVPLALCFTIFGYLLFPCRNVKLMVIQVRFGTLQRPFTS